MMFEWNSSTGTNVINSRTGAVLYTGIPTGLAPFEISFDPVDPDVYYFLSGAALVSRKLSTSTNTTVHAFPATLQSLGGTNDFITSDGRYFVVIWSDAARVYDKQTDTLFTNSIAGFIAAGGWTGITPNGSHLVAQAGPTGSPNAEHYSYTINTSTRTLNTTPVQFVGLGGDHGDLISASNGKSYEVKFNSDYSPPGLYLWDLDVSMAGIPGQTQVNTAARALVTTSSFNDADGHLSCVAKGPFQDWCFWSSEYNSGDTFNSDPTADWSNYRQEIIAVNVLTAEVRRLAHHRSRGLTSDYFASPRISSSWDGSVIVWASNYNINAPPGYADLYGMLFTK